MNEAVASVSLSPAQRRQIVTLTISALAVFALFRWLPTGTNLSHGDFRLEGDNVLEFCDPSAPQFLPVTTARSPVTLGVSPNSIRRGEPQDFVVTLTTSSGKKIGPVDLLVAHTRKLHLMVVDPSLRDYQHVHPEVGPTPEEWSVSFTPKFAGDYRVFADFTPTATARGLYASADISVSGEAVAQGEITRNWTAALGDYRFDLRPKSPPVRTRTPADLTLVIQRHDGAEVVLGTVMDAFAHLVAFDRERTGFAHLHPRETDLSTPLDPRAPELHFQVTIPEGGLYVIWAQMVLDGAEVFVPFWFDVEP
jgi:hypothetical protein